ncbi:phospholipid-transporting ATPase FetA-like [Ictidomys tridecemlineatus]|nr:phospholipid-transporting ATPase FetA-like [Ictidomys tridecemlineatus]
MSLTEIRSEHGFDGREVHHSFLSFLFSPHPPPEYERFLQANNREFNALFGYPNNAIKTSKYTILNFLPLNLFEQFQRLANAYFLVLLILQLIPQISSLAWYTTVVPLVVVLSITGVKDAIDDLKRHQSDNQVNNCSVLLLADGRVKEDKWMNVQVGDIIKLKNDQAVPADLLLLSSSEPYSLTYIETADLDGETNLKVKQAITSTSDLEDNLELLSVFDGEVKCDPPNNKLDKFTGILTYKRKSYPLDHDKLLLRGCIIRNTDWCFGLVIYTDEDRTKGETFVRKALDRQKTHPDNREVLPVTTRKMTRTPRKRGSKDSGNEEEVEKGKDNFKKLAGPAFPFNDKTLVEAVKKGDYRVHLFFLSLSLCHTVMSQEKVEGELVYQAQSPDEGALVTAARNLGFVFRSRTSETITVVEMGKTRVYQLLAILDFNNVRKRMSVIVRTPENRVILFCKGADTIICELLHRSCVALNKVTMEHLDDFASEGLRTLMVAYRELDDKFFQTWRKKHNEACLSVKDREIKLSTVYEEIEKDLMLLGATGIEDKLQDGVPETIITLNKARIKIWVLTGDKQETAVNIAYSCNVFEDEMDEVFVIEGKDSDTILQELRRARGRMKPESLLESDPINIYLKRKSKRSFTMPEEVPSGDYGLIISGYSLAYALEGNLELELLRTASMCKGVICCRMTPFQKAQVVELVKRYKKVVTLAIGDGANDVSMIKAAHIGVGISGQEGMQAMLNSDFAFSQFRYLQRLLLVHGRWSYNRMCKFLSFFFYKNFVFTLVHFWYAFFNGFSAQAVYDTWFITCYNLIYTSLPVLGLSLFDQDVNETWSLHFPELYIPGQHNLYFNKKEFVKCLLHGIYSSFVLFFVPMGTIYNSARSDGKDISDIQTFCLLVQTSLIWVVTVQIALQTTYWTMISHFVIWGSLGFYFCILFFLYSDGLCLMFPTIFQFLGVARNTMNQSQLWLGLILSVILCIIPAFGYQFLQPLIWPLSVDKVLDTIHYGKIPPPQVQVRTKVKHPGLRRSAYAFSHKQGFGALITSGKTTKAKKNSFPLKK